MLSWRSIPASRQGFLDTGGDKARWTRARPKLVGTQNLKTGDSSCKAHIEA
ncbi:hypothetical protein COCC4DRAFT_31915, partial [Bipolaris maydis ATCC 48331]